MRKLQCVRNCTLQARLRQLSMAVTRVHRAHTFFSLYDVTSEYRSIAGSHLVAELNNINFSTRAQKQRAGRNSRRPNDLMDLTFFHSILGRFFPGRSALVRSFGEFYFK